MKTKKNITIISFTIAGFFSLLYIIFAATPLSKEYNFIPEWNLNLTGPTSQNITKDTKLIEFQLGQTVGYFTENGQIAQIKSFPQKASISNKFFTTYTTQAKQTDFFNSDGSKAGCINEEGFPYFNDDRIYLMQPCGTTYSKCNSTGEILWTNQSVIPITSFSSNENFTVTGYADGIINLVENTQGYTVLEFSPSGSDYNIIFGVDISPDGKYIASLSGHNKQRFCITEREGDQTKTIFHKYLDNELSRRTLVKFSKDGKKIFYNYNDGLGIYDLEEKKLYEFPIKDKIISVEESSNLLFLLSKSENIYTVYILEKTNYMQGSFSFNAKDAFIQTFNDVLYVGKDTTISKMIIEKK